MLKSVFTIITLLLVTSCGDSPLLNHDKEKLSPGAIMFPSVVDTFHLKKIGYSFTIDWAATPKVGENEFHLNFWQTTTATSAGPFSDPEGHELFVYLWMPSMGHGSSPVKIARSRSGVYQVYSVFFIMSGEWEIHVQMKKASKVVDEVVLPIRL